MKLQGAKSLNRMQKQGREKIPPKNQRQGQQGSPKQSQRLELQGAKSQGRQKGQALRQPEIPRRQDLLKRKHQCQPIAHLGMQAQSQSGKGLRERMENRDPVQAGLPL